MKGWLAANCFLAGMALLAAGLTSISLFSIPRIGLPPNAERFAVGISLCLSLIATGLIARAVLRRIERRR